MKNTVLVIQIIVAVLLVGAILLQAKGTGLGMAFGEAAEQYRSKRGVEKFLYQGTTILALIFFLTSLVNLLVR